MPETEYLQYRSDDPNGGGPEDGFTTLTMQRSRDGDIWLGLPITPGERTCRCRECNQPFPGIFRVRLSGSSDPRNFEVLKALGFLEIALRGEKIPAPWDMPGQLTLESLGLDLELVDADDDTEDDLNGAQS